MDNVLPELDLSTIVKRKFYLYIREQGTRKQEEIQSKWTNHWPPMRRSDQNCLVITIIPANIRSPLSPEILMKNTPTLVFFS
jgi:hypothetical protein